MANTQQPQLQKDMQYLCTWMYQDRDRVRDGRPSTYHEGQAVKVAEKLHAEGVSLDYRLCFVNPSTSGSSGQETPLMHAVGWANDRFLVHDCNYPSVIPGSLPVVKAILKSPVDLERQDASGATALWRACETVHSYLFDDKQADIAIALLKAGANPNVQVGENKNTPLMLAVSRNPKLMEALLEAGADPHLKNAQGYSADGMIREFYSRSDICNKANIALLDRFSAGGDNGSTRPPAASQKFRPGRLES